MAFHSQEIIKNLFRFISTDKFERCYLSLPCQYNKLSLDGYGLNPDSFPPQLSRDWPEGRFVWFTEDRQCRIFVNFLDHIKLYISQPGGDIQKAFRQYSELLSSLEESLKLSEKKFVWSSKYGFLTSSPNNIGTGLEVRVRARLPKVIKVMSFPRTVRQLRQFKLFRLARKFDTPPPPVVFNLLAHRMSLMRKH